MTTKPVIPLGLVKKIIKQQNQNLMETLEELTDKEYMTQVKEARNDYKVGRAIGFEEFKKRYKK